MIGGVTHIIKNEVDQRREKNHQKKINNRVVGKQTKPHDHRETHHLSDTNRQVNDLTNGRQIQKPLRSRWFSLSSSPSSSSSS